MGAWLFLLALVSAAILPHPPCALLQNRMSNLAAAGRRFAMNWGSLIAIVIVVLQVVKESIDE